MPAIISNISNLSTGMEDRWKAESRISRSVEKYVSLGPMRDRNSTSNKKQGFLGPMRGPISKEKGEDTW